MSTPPYDNSILFAGYYRDEETGLYHVRNRTYHPALGRWMQRDPAGYQDGMSLYEYVKSRAGSQRDPQGLVSASSPSAWDPPMDDPGGQSSEPTTIGPYPPPGGCILKPAKGNSPHEYLDSKWDRKFRFPLLSLGSARFRAKTELLMKVRRLEKAEIILKGKECEEVCHWVRRGDIYYEAGLVLNWLGGTSSDWEQTWVWATVKENSVYNNDECATGPWWDTHWEAGIQIQRWQLSWVTAKLEMGWECYWRNSKTKEKSFYLGSDRGANGPIVDTVSYKLRYRWDKTKPTTSDHFRNWWQRQYPSNKVYPYGLFQEGTTFVNNAP